MATYTVPTDFKLIDSAVATASPGDTIVLDGDIFWDSAIAYPLDKDGMTFEVKTSHQFSVKLGDAVTTFAYFGQTNVMHELIDSQGDNELTFGTVASGVVTITGGHDVIHLVDETKYVRLAIDWSSDTTDVVVSMPEGLYKSGVSSITADAAFGYYSVKTGSGNDNVTLLDRAVSVDTGAGDDTIDVRGHLGEYSTFSGGDGNDIYHVDWYSTLYNSKAIKEGKTAQAGDHDRVVFSGSYTFILPDNVEDLTIAGNHDGNGEGNALSNIMVGDDSNNVLDGKDGQDSMAGGKGDDTYYGIWSQDTFTEAADEGDDTLILSGSPGAVFEIPQNFENVVLFAERVEYVKGTAADNKIECNAGKQTIDGGAGADDMAGGIGRDVYYLDNPGDRVTDTSGYNRIYIETAGDMKFLNAFGDIYFKGSGAINLVSTYTASVQLHSITIHGNSADNAIKVNYGTSLHGGGGDDTLQGEAKLIEGGIGNDVIRTAYAKQVSGGAGKDVIYGGWEIDGGRGADRLIGGFIGNLYVDVDVSDTIIETDPYDSRYNDRVTFSGRGGMAFILPEKVEDIELIGSKSINAVGNDLRNTIIGNDGHNVLTGGLGRDFMRGGMGRDTFRFVTRADSDEQHADVIRDFQRGLDRIDLTAFDNGSLADTIVVDKHVSYVLYGIRVTVDLEGDGAIDLSFHLGGIKSISESDFLL